MAGVWQKTMRYLGLVEEDELEEQESAPESVEPLPRREAITRPTPLRRPAPVAASVEEPSLARAGLPEEDSMVRTIPQSRPASGTIHRAEPKRFNEARELGDRFKDGVPVIMNLQGTEDSIARRLVDFASGLVFAREGKIELVANRVYLLTPRDVEVSAEERERLREGGFYNQF
jgi:cell division inhibitor SepF